MLVYKTNPFSHQRTVLESSISMHSFAVFWEQGTGKTKLTIDTAANLYLREEIDAVLVVAPNGVHRNWVVDEIPTHLPDGIPCLSLFYQSGKASTKWHQEEVAGMMAPFKGLKVLAMTYEAVTTDKGSKIALAFLKAHKAMLVVDESQRAKTPSAQRTKYVTALAKYAKYRRILSGTPVANSPFDIWSQMKVLDPDFWKKFSLNSFYVFKQRFGVWKKGHNGQTGQEFDQLVNYKHLEYLNKLIEPYSSRVLKDDVLDLPEKIYKPRYFDLSPEQQRLYNQLRDQCIAWLESGEVITAPLAITKMLRLQQVTCGYIPADEAEELTIIDGPNPRLNMLEEIISDTPGQIIVFARFQKDLSLIMQRLKEMKVPAVRYDGTVSTEDRGLAIKAFQHDKTARVFVANPAVAGEGITLTAAKTVVYYNNSFKLTERLQSEDRAHRIGQKNNVLYIDLIAPGTIDEKVVNALQKKMNLAAQVTGDSLKEWLK